MSDKPTSLFEFISEPENPNPTLFEEWEKIDRGLRARAVCNR